MGTDEPGRAPTGPTGAPGPPVAPVAPGAPGAPTRLREPRRPLLWAAGALTTGSALGAAELLSRSQWSWLAAVLAAAWIAWRCSARRAGGAGSSREPLESVEERAGLGIGVLLLVLCLGAARAAPLEPPAGAPRPPGWSRGVAAWEGVWRTRRLGAEEMQGTLASAEARESRALRFEVPRGAARDGERVRILRGEPPALAARGSLSRDGSPSAPDAGATEFAREDAADAAGPIVARADEVLRVAAQDERRSWPAAWRERLDRRAAALADREAGALARAFLLGDASALDPDVGDLFTRNGLRHVLAVSGWHVAMMAWWIVQPFAALAGALAARWPRRRALLAGSTMLASVLLCAAYAPLTGGGAPVRRAAIAVALAASASAWPRSPCGSARRVDALSLWSAALLAECWFDPAAVAEVSVQLSYAATLGLILGTRPVTALLARAVGATAGPSPRELLHGPLRACAAAWRRRALRASLTGVAASLAAVAATAPIVWLTFGEACSWGVLTTPLLAPLFVLLFASGMLMLFVPVELLERAFAFVGRLLVEAMQFVDGLPGTPSLLPERPAWLIVGAVLAAWLAARSSFRSAPARAASLAAAAALALPWAPTASDFELHVLDVGHGTAVLFRAPGEPGWIFDCGSRDRARVAQEALGPLLRAFELDHPVVVLSHLDSDHAGGLAWVVERAPPRMWIGALAAPWSERIPHTCARLDVGPGVFELPERAPDLSVTLLRGSGLPGNEGSRSLLLEVAGTRILLSGDAAAEGWPASLREHLARRPGGFLLAPHHGSQGPRIGVLLDSMAPEAVWISGSKEPAIAAELDRRGLPWKLTARDGPLVWRPP